MLAPRPSVLCFGIRAGPAPLWPLWLTWERRGRGFGRAAKAIGATRPRNGQESPPCVDPQPPVFASWRQCGDAYARARSQLQ